MSLTYASIFAGIGGFDAGLDRAGMSPTCQVEVNAHAATILAAHWPTTHRTEDVRDTTARDLGAPDVVVGGFPCQDTSIAAPHRAGLDGARSHLFFDFARLLDETARLLDGTRPRWAVIENPTGLLRSNGGRDMDRVRGTLADLGYGWAYRVLDTGGTGPQRRHRVIIVGHRGGDPRPAGHVLADPGAGREDARLVDTRRRGGPGRLAPHGVASPHDGSLTVWRKSRRPRSASDYSTWVDDGAANTLTGFDAGTRQTHVMADRGRLRRPVLAEWERLQGFRAGWTAGIPDSARFTALGNAMHADAAAWLGHRIATVDAALPMLPWRQPAA